MSTFQEMMNVAGSSHGRHVKVLGRGAPDRLGNLAIVESTLVELVGLLGMRPLGSPHMYEVETEISKLGVEPFEDEGGVTGVCVLSTSHCAIHTWPLRPFFVMDVYSCRDFDPAKVEEHLARKLGACDLQVTDLSFSLEYDRAPSRAKPRSTPKRSARDALRGWAKRAV
jgi:S-adenosylmethionine decarboxylase